MRILVIEDEYTLLNDLCKGLRIKGYAVDQADNGKKGYQMAIDEEYDLIILDLNLPEMDGLELLTRLKKEKQQQKLSGEIKKRNINNFAEPLKVPQSSDEIQELTVSFNQLLEEVRHSFQIQKQFSADAAHELRTPLAVLQTKIDVFSMGRTLDDDTQGFLKILREQVERLTALIDDLLLFSRDLPLENMEIVYLHPLLTDVVSELAELAEEKNMEINLDCSEETVCGQDRLLERVFYNLLENAVKYSPAGTTISISVKQEKGKTVVVFADQGEGIPPTIEKIFLSHFSVLINPGVGLLEEMVWGWQSAGKY